MKEKSLMRALEDRCRQECYPIYFTRFGTDYTIPYIKEAFLDEVKAAVNQCYDPEKRTPLMYSRRDYENKRTWHIQFK